MVLQEIDSDYIGREQLVRLLKRKFGNNYSFHEQRGGQWIVEVPDYLSDVRSLLSLARLPFFPSDVAVVRYPGGAGGGLSVDRGKAGGMRLWDWRMGFEGWDWRESQFDVAALQPPSSGAMQVGDKTAGQSDIFPP